MDFLIKPEEVGIQQFSVHISELEGEISTRNNHKAIFINVLETRVKVAIFAGGPHPDVGAIHKTLERDERYEVIDFIHKDRQAWYNSPDNYQLEDFDLLILHNFPF